MNKLKNFILNNDFLTEKIKSLYGAIPRFFFDGFAFPPLSVTLLISYQCNLRCKMCFYYNEKDNQKILSLIEKNKNEELTLDEIKDLISDLKKMKVKILTLHGGEPLLYPKISEIIDYARKNDLCVRFVTNGTLINEKKAKMFVEKNVEHITISLDGPENIHDQIRGKKGTFEKATNGAKLIEKFKKEFKKDLPHLNFGTTISSLNQNHLEDVIEIAKNCGLDKVTFILTSYNEEGFSEKTKEILKEKEKIKEPGSLEKIEKSVSETNPEILKKQREKIKKLSQKYNINVFFPTKEMIKKHNEPFYNQDKTCHYFWTTSVISPYGDVYPCINFSFLNISMGNIKEEKFSQIWNNQKYQELRKKMKKYNIFPICHKCCFINLGEKL